MEIRKSAELHNWLLRLNFTILVWQLNIGDWIEAAVDWSVSWINEAYNLATIAYNWARDAWDRAGELYNMAVNYVNRLRVEILGRFESLGSYLSDWWTARKRDLQDWTDARLYDLKSYTNSILLTVNSLASAWESFRRDTLPSLVSFTWFRSWWGNASITFNDWWGVKERELRERTEVQLSPIRDQVNRQASLLDLIKELFQDPEKWLLDRLESMLARFW